MHENAEQDQNIRKTNDLEFDALAILSCAFVQHEWLVATEQL